jgi:hypothetical protein
MATASDIIDRLGGLTIVSRKLRLPLTTVQGWKDSNYVPEWRRAALLAMASDESLSLATDEFPSVDERKPRKAKQAA